MATLLQSRSRPQFFLPTHPHDEPPVYQPGSLHQAEVCPAELDQPVVVEDLHGAGGGAADDGHHQQRVDLLLKVALEPARYESGFVVVLVGRIVSLLPSLPMWSVANCT